MRKLIIALTVLAVLLAGTTALAAKPSTTVQGPISGGGQYGPISGGGQYGPISGGGQYGPISGGGMF